METIKETISLDQLKNGDNYMSNSLPKLDAAHAYYQKLKELVNLIKNIHYTDLHFKDSGKEGIYLVVLPDDIEKLKQEYLGMAPNTSKMGWNFNIQTEGFHMFNRLHFPDALPTPLQGTGFGLKIYEAFITYLGFASSHRSASDSAKNVWLKIIQDIKFECVIDARDLLVVNKNLHNKLAIVKEFIRINSVDINAKSTVMSESLYNAIYNHVPQHLGGGSQETHYQHVPLKHEAHNMDIGDKVHAVDVDYFLIRNNSEIAQELGATNWQPGDSDLQENDIVKILNIATYRGESIALVYNARTNKQYIINLEGLSEEPGTGVPDED